MYILLTKGVKFGTENNDRAQNKTTQKCNGVGFVHSFTVAVTPKIGGGLLAMMMVIS